MRAVPVFERGHGTPSRFTAWLGQYSSHNKQKRLLGELHARMLASGKCCTDRLGLRTEYLPALTSILVRPLVDQEKDGIAAVVAAMTVNHSRNRRKTSDRAFACRQQVAV